MRRRRHTRTRAVWRGSSFNDYCNEEVTKLLEATVATADKAEQAKLYFEVQDLMYEDPPNLLLYYNFPIIAYNGNLRNIPRGEILYAVPYSYKIYMEQ
jgi:ABC-type transport system substrate-binding protein